MFVKYKNFLLVKYENQKPKSSKGGEYDSTLLNELCEKEGMINEVILHYSPKPNGIVERKNIILKKMMNSLLISSCAPNNLQDKAILSACHAKQNSL